MYIFRLKIHTHRRYVKKPSAETQVSTGANEKRFINKTYIYRFLKQRSFASSRGTHSKTGKNTMKPLIRILSLWLAALCFGACTDDDLIDGTPTPEPETGIVIRLSAGDLEQTRTELTSQANLHHVEKVYALLYKGHGDTATFYACDELEWNPKESADETGVQEQRKEFLLPQSGALAKGAYTVLCVGLDDESGETYNLPEAIKNKTLSEAKATLAEGKTKDDIAKSELFAGWNQFHFAPDSLNIVEVEMKRRVAGVICYLTDIPYTITEGSDVYRITKVQLRLFTNQNSSIKLCRDEVITNVDGKASYPDDFGESPLSDSQIIDEYILEDKSYSHTSDYTLYQFDLSTNERKLAPNSILMGNYMIPIKFDSQKANQTDNKLIDQVTLQVVLLGKKVDSKENEPADTAPEEIVRSFPAINDDIDLEEVTESDGSVSYEPTKNYPIRPNIIYHIGNKPSDEEEGTPESLAGTKVNIVAEEWTDQEIHVEFPSVPVVAYIELVREYLDANGNKKVEIYDENSDYTFDCIGIDDEDPEGYYKTGERLYARVHPSVLTKNWTLAITEGLESTSSNSKTLETLFVSKGNGNYEGSYSGTGQEVEDIRLLLTSYAEDDGQKERYATLTLTMNGDGGNQLKPVSMKIKQYNAIIVKVYDKNNNLVGTRGFCHEDWLGGVTEWGYSGIFSTNIIDFYLNWYSGGTYLDEARNNTKYYNDYFVYSAIYKAARKFLSVTGNTKDTNSEDWYLPARYELRDFLDHEKNNTELLDKRYWASNAYGSARAYSNYIYKNNKGEIELYDNTTNEVDVGNPVGLLAERTEKYYMRQACVVE